MGVGSGKLKPQTITLLGEELATYNGEKWFLKELETRRHYGIFGTYTINEWESIINTVNSKYSTNTSEIKTKRRALL